MEKTKVMKIGKEQSNCKVKPKCEWPCGFVTEEWEVIQFCVLNAIDGFTEDVVVLKGV